MKTIFSFFLFLASTLVFLIPMDVEAIPAFARQTGESCYKCHYAFPKLNEKGMIFKYYGYRFKPDKGDSVWEQETVPLGFKIEVMGMAKWGDIPEKQDLQVHEIVFYFGGPIAKRFSAFGAVKIHGDESEIEETIGRVQWDNMFGMNFLNLAAGNVNLDFPFLSPPRKITHQFYLAQDMGHLLGGEVAVELNGQILTTNTISSYRYNFGVRRDSDVNDDNKLSSLYGTLTLGLAGKHYIGLHYRFAGENQGFPSDNNVHRTGVAGELNFGPASLNGGYFFANYDTFGGNASELTAHDFVVEALFKVGKKLILGIREDFLWAEQGAVDGNMNALTIHSSYYFIPNGHVLVEYQNIDHSGLNRGLELTPTGVTENKVMVMMVGAF